LLGEGDQLPTVTLLDDRGAQLTTADLLGGPLILYPQFQAKKARIVGVSRDSAESHRRFKEKFSIPFELLADTESKLCDAFGVIVEKNMYGKKSKGIARSTFLIDGSGKIVKVWPKVNVDEHADEVLASF
jgi:peroxiredoxin Q/BCP